MPVEGILWFLGFHTVEGSSDLNVALRTDVLPMLRRQSGVVDALAGHRSHDEGWDHLITATVDVEPTADRLDRQIRSWLAERWDVDRLESRLDPVALVVRAEREEPARILRLFRGQVEDGMLESYLEAARADTIDQTRHGAGPTMLCLAVDPPRRFATISTWLDWSAIESATGGSVDRPIATKRHRGLLGGEAYHYELVEAASERPLALQP